MSDTRPSIAELEAAEQSLPSDWRYDYQGYIESMCRTLNHTGAETEVLVLGARNEHSDGEDIVALRNAAPALIAIAKAARTVLEMFDENKLPKLPNRWHGIEGAKARAVLRDALSAVRP